MKVDGIAYRPIRLNEDGWSVEIIDQTKLPHTFELTTLETPEDAAHAIKAMLVRGAPLIGATAAYGMALAMRRDASDDSLRRNYDMLYATRPTAVNLRWALDRMDAALSPLPAADRSEAAYRLASEICEEDVELNASIGHHGLALIREQYEKKQRPINILTHCNAGWLATVDWGTALAPIYMAHNEAIPVHVWAEETRPRNQGASLTTWELMKHGVPVTLIVDNSGGHLMQHGQVDLCIVGTDRTTSCGDVCNKIGTYLKGLAAHDNGVPFYVALPSPTIDWTIRDGIREIPIEERDPSEVLAMTGRDCETAAVCTVHIAPEGAKAANHSFDVTPARYVTGLITERGVCPATEEGLRALFPDLAQAAGQA